MWIRKHSYKKQLLFIGSFTDKNFTPRPGKDDGTGEAAAFAKAVDIPILASIPADEDLRRKSANYQIVGTKSGQWGAMFEELASNVAEAPPLRPAPLTQDGLLELFSASEAPTSTSRSASTHRRPAP